MRNLLILAWLCVPLLALAYHYGPGQEQMQIDQVAEQLRQGQLHAEEGQWAAAIAQFDAALAQLPEDEVHLERSVRLEKAKAQMFVSELPAAHRTLKGLLEDQLEDPQADADLLAETRRALASSQYYMTWLLRLEGQPEEKWKPEIEAARQHYKLLASATTGKARSGHQEDLEAAIRLARMDLDELQGLPLPSQ